MQVIQKVNPGAYRQPRAHYVADEGTVAICGTDVAKVKGDRRGSYNRPRIVRRDLDGFTGYVCIACAKKAAGPSGSAKLSIPAMKALIAQAGEAGQTAFDAAIPRPMIVGTPRNPVASLMGKPDGGLDPNQEQWYVSEGICGAGGVRVVPGNSRFARFLVKDDYAMSRAYQGGVLLQVWKICGDRGSQSYARWDAASQAIVQVLTDAGITAYNASWID